MNIKEQVNNMIKEAKFLEVSDIHFHPKENSVSIYYRILGKLVYQNEVELDNYNKILRYLKFITRLDVAINRKPQDGSFYLKDKEEKIFVRIATIPLIKSESLVIRILIDQTDLNINNVSFFENDIKEMAEVILNQTGLFIFTGPTGSGKTTTIYSIMDYLATSHSKKIITLENPVEIINKNLMQVQVDEKLNITYANSLKATLRQDPDIIMIGEIRDEETARNVFRAALTGHTVVSTMHTKDIYGVVERFLDFGFLQSEIESVLIGISNQRLFLDNKGEVKSIYSFEIGKRLNKVIRKDIKAVLIEDKIEVAKKVNKQSENIKINKKSGDKEIKRIKYKNNIQEKEMENIFLQKDLVNIEGEKQNKVKNKPISIDKSGDFYDKVSCQNKKTYRSNKKRRKKFVNKSNK